MAKDDSPNSGLLSKVARFVRNPTTNWSDLDEKLSDRQDSAYTKQVLKEMMERKRRNDFVRKREFDMLRKLRRREALAGGEGGMRPSFFQSSIPSKPDDRAMTLKKIDEIEAQMSMQWWKTKHGQSSSPPTSSNFGISETPPADAPTAEILATAKTPPKEHPVTQPLGNYDLTRPDTLHQALSAINPQPLSSNTPMPPTRPRDMPTVRQPANAVQQPMAEAGGGQLSVFSASKTAAVEVADLQHDPELEEAAIRFANGDDAGAEAGLKEAIGPQGTRAGHEDTWYALFDLYRATGQQHSFESLAIDFATRFHQSAPTWYSIPDLIEQGKPAAQQAAQAGKRGAAWRCPAVLGVQTLAALNASLGKTPMPWHFDWSALQTIEPTAVVPLSRLMAAWASQPVQLRFSGCDQLDKVLQTLTPSNNAEASQDGWRLRMEALRIMHRPDEFELAALDFCVTYEVSPPAWSSARCEFKPLDASGASATGQTIISDVPTEAGSLSAYGETQAGGLQPTGQVSSVELSGQIQGDAGAALAQLDERMSDAQLMVISCAKLIRVDFSAAGSLLNWVSSRTEEGRVIQFTQVHRLVAAFFNVISISEHARISLRVD